MEVGAVKQAFNNELILLKKKLNQAKIQVIHKLTRKAKTLVEKKAPDPLKEKFKRKAESAVKEVLIIKKIKVRDIGKFIVTHTKQLQDHLNKPEPDLDRACARLLLHKALIDKYKSIRDKFHDVPIDDLLMSRQERRKIKKEAKEEQKNKIKAKQEKKDKKNKAVSKEGDWDVEDVKTDLNNEINDDSKDLDSEDNDKIENKNSDCENSDSINSDDDQTDSEVYSKNKHDDVQNDELESSDDLNDDEEVQNDELESTDDQNDDEENIDEIKVTETQTKPQSKKKVSESQSDIKKSGEGLKNLEFKLKIGNKVPNSKAEKKAKEKKQKDTNKNKNLKDKIQHKKFSKNSEGSNDTEKKVADPFFVTSSGENYMSVAEIRPPDEIKEEHRKGNRQLRRDRIFGRAPKRQPRSFRNEAQFDRRINNTENSNGHSRNHKFDSNEKYSKERSNFRPREDKQSSFKERDERRSSFNKREDFKDNNNKRAFEGDSKPDKLHPSWEAKKKQSGIQPFQGKKIVFN